MIKRIGLLTSGGDCQALNATMRGVVKGLTNSIDDLEVYGFDDGYKGLIYGKYRNADSQRFLWNSDTGRHDPWNIPTAVQADACTGCRKDWTR